MQCALQTTISMCEQLRRLLHETNLPSITRGEWESLREKKRQEDARREVYLGKSEDGKDAALAARCLNIPTTSSPHVSAVSTDMAGRYRYGLHDAAAAAASEINASVKGDDPQLICGCLTLLPLVAGPGCCIPGALPSVLQKEFSQAFNCSASPQTNPVFPQSVCSHTWTWQSEMESMDLICAFSQVALISWHVRNPIGLSTSISENEPSFFFFFLTLLLFHCSRVIRRKCSIQQMKKKQG